MSQKKRKLGYWGIEFLNGDETYFDGSLFENFIEYVKGLDSTHSFYNEIPKTAKQSLLIKFGRLPAKEGSCMRFVSNHVSTITALTICPAEMVRKDRQKSSYMKATRN